jgi:hypothetical protein
MTDNPKLEATLEELEAERRRRMDEKIERGEAIRVPALSVVVGTPDEADDALEDMRVRVLTADRNAGGKAHEVYFEEPAVLITGVPRANRRPDVSLTCEDSPEAHRKPLPRKRKPDGSFGALVAS